MYIITNRRLDTTKKSLKIFGDRPSEMGPNELRLVKLSKAGSTWKPTEKRDKITSKARLKTLSDTYGLKLDPEADYFASLEVAADLFHKARKEKKSILLFVHGYNNDIEDVVQAAEELEQLYNTIVVPFTWPANGGGPVSGTASYLSDKRDARASVGAFNRAVEKFQQLHQLYTEGVRTKLEQKALKKFPNNRSVAYEYLGKLLADECVVKMNLLCHSMGNYLLKHSLLPSDNVTSELVFDNICLVAADTNNEDHRSWVDKLQVRNRVYIVINEKDYALGASRVKPGKQQKARLGHSLQTLNSRIANYVDVTEQPGVKSQHSYFKGDYLEKNPQMKTFFQQILTGESADSLLQYRADVNCYNVVS